MAQGGGLPAVGYAVPLPGKVVWAVDLMCGVGHAHPLPVAFLEGCGVALAGRSAAGVHVAHPAHGHGPVDVASLRGSLLTS